MLKIKDLCIEIGDGLHGTPQYDINGDYYFINGNNLSNKFIIVDSTTKKLSKNESEKFKKPIGKNTLLISINGTLGEMAFYNDENIILGKSACYLNFKSIKDKEFVYYLFCTKPFKKYLNMVATGSTIKNIAPKQIGEFAFNMPVFKDKISNILSNLDSVIENNNKIIYELESMAKTIYDYWFLQFDFPDENGRPYKSSGGKMVWNEELKRDIPEGWHNGTLKSLGNIIGGGTPSTNNEEYYTDNGISWITPKDLSETNNKFIRHGERDITQKGLSNSSAVLMPRGTVLMTSRAPIGYLGIASNEVCTNQGFKSILPKESYDSEFIYQTLNMLMPYIKQIGSGSTFAEVSKSDMEKINIIIPSVKIRVLFNNKIKSINELIENLENENKELASLRDFLLPMLMNGQVTFKEL